MIRKTGKMAGGVFALLLLCLSLSLPMSRAASAAGEVWDPERACTVTVTPQAADGSRLKGEQLAFIIYRVADMYRGGTQTGYRMTGAFAGCGADLSELKSFRMPGKMAEASGEAVEASADKASGKATKALAEKLEDYARLHEISGIRREADAEGTVRFTELSAGLYLVVYAEADGGLYTAEPFLISAPFFDGDGGRWIYDIDASPKTELAERIDISVRKVWNDGGDVGARPGSIYVTLSRGKEAVETIELNAGNHWSHTWRRLPKSDSYEVKEAAVSGYAATYDKNGYEFMITNSAGLAQTGQLNWPVPVLAGSGVIVFAAGWSRRFLKKRK